MDFWIGLIAGVIIGWLLEWLIDWRFWRMDWRFLRQKFDEASALEEARRERDEALAELARLQSKRGA